MINRQDIDHTGVTRLEPTRERPRSYAPPSDIVVKDPEGWPVAMVEIKGRQGLTRGIAIATRRNLLTHGLISRRVPFFLMISQDAGFLWNQQSGIVPDDPPTAEFPMEPVLRHYLRRLGPDVRLSASSLGLVVADWLADQAAGLGPDLRTTIDPLAETGFLAAIEDATVTITEQR